MTFGSIAASQALPGLLQPKSLTTAGTEKYAGPLSKFRYDPSNYQPDIVTPGAPYRPVYAAEGGIMQLMPGGLSALQTQRDGYGAPETPDGNIPQFATGGIANLGGYSDGGRLLKGPGDGMSDDIPASISGKQPARLADGEFVVPADVVSHLGNGSTDAGAKQLYSMMDKVRKARTGRKAQGKQINPNKYVPA
jgi:hypothetical protein